MHFPWTDITFLHQAFTLRASLKSTSNSSIFGGGGGGWKGNGGGGHGGNDEDFNEGGSRPFSLLALFNLVSNIETHNLISQIAESIEEEEEEVEEEVEVEEVFIKPAPKPKPESINWGKVSSIVLFMLLVSGGFFFWRRSKTQSPPNLEEGTIVQQTREIEILPEESNQQTSEQGAVFVHDLERKDQFFTQNATESAIPTELLKPTVSDAAEQLSAALDKRTDSIVEVELPVGDPQNLGEGLEFAKSAEATTEQYYSDLNDKDAFFDTSPKTEVNKGDIVTIQSMI